MKIDLIVRGICCLRPGVPGLSENIRVKSIVGRFLEHRASSASAPATGCRRRRPRCSSPRPTGCSATSTRRVETLVPIENDDCHQQVMSQVMVANLKDVTSSWLLQPDGTYASACSHDEERLLGPHLLHDQPQPVRPRQRLEEEGRRRLQLARRRAQSA